MSYAPQLDLRPDMGGWLHEPPWADEAHVTSPSWKDSMFSATGHLAQDSRNRGPNTPMPKNIAISPGLMPASVNKGRSTGSECRKDGEQFIDKSMSNMANTPDRQPLYMSRIAHELRAASDAFESPQQHHFTIQKSQSNAEGQTESYENLTNSHDSQPPRQVNDQNQFGTTEGDMEDQSTAWKEVRNLREELLGLRSYVYQKRLSLRKIDDAKAEADNLLYSRMMMIGNGLRPEEFSHHGSGPKSLQHLMHACQSIRDAYGPALDDLFAQEERLSRLEFKLNRLEQPFFARTYEPHLSKFEPSLVVQLSAVEKSKPQAPDSISSSTSVEASEDMQCHPLVTHYHSKLGRLEILQERHDEILNEERFLEAERISRAQFGRVLDTVDQVRLDGSQAKYDNIVHELSLLEEEVAQLKTECLTKGLVDENDEPINFRSQEEASFHDEDGLNAKDQTSEYVKYPKLLPLPTSRKHESIKFYESEFDDASDLSATRINKWILVSLRMSPLEVNFLARTFERTGSQPNAQWEIDVLELWYKDGTSKPTGTAERPSSLVTEADIIIPEKSRYFDNIGVGTFYPFDN